MYWTWIGGTQNRYAYGVYGGKGVPSPDHSPGSRYSHILLADSKNNLYAFGGYAYLKGTEAGKHVFPPL